MSDIESNIDINIGVGESLANLRLLQREISAFYSSMSKGGAAANAQSAMMQQNLINTINATGKFNASIRTISSTTETFTNALERNKLSMGEYFRFAGGATQRFGKFFSAEMSTIDKVARERVKDLQTQFIRLGRDANGSLKSIAVRPLALDMEDLATKTALAAQKQQLFNQLVKQGSTNLLNFGKNTQWAGRQLMVGFTIPLSIFGGMAAKTFMDLEKQTLAFKKVYGDLFTLDVDREKALEDVKALSLELTKYGATVESVMQTASEAAAAGFQGADLMAQTEQATRLSILGQLDMQKALDTTIALQSAFQTSSEDLAESIDFLNAVENQTVLSLDDVTTAIPKVAPVVQQLGGDVKDLAFFLTAMKEGGINASEGANALKSGLGAIINPTKQSSELLASMGINIRQIVDSTRGDLKATMFELATALDGLDPLNRARAIEQLFGKFQFARISALFSNIIRDGSQAQRVLDLAGYSVEELASLSENELGVVAEATSTRFAAAMEKIKVAVAPIGEEFLKLLIPIMEFGAQALESFNNLDSGVRQFVVGAIALIGGIAPVAIMTFGLLANGAANAIKGFLFLRNIFLKTGQSSDILGQEVDYMTQQQLEASAVASSLGQTHSRLVQIFTSEKAALDALTAAYQQAVAAQRQFSGPVVPAGPMRPGPRPTGYNKGVVMVPGTGNKDTEPAMLTPGEAVIPAPMVEKYGPLISAMINGQIPGYNNGRTGDIPIFPEYAVRLQDPRENMSQIAASISRLEQVLAPLAIRVGEARGIAPTQFSVTSGKFDTIAKELEPITKKFVDQVNKNFTETYKDIDSSNERFSRSWTAAGIAVEQEINRIKSDVDRGVVRKVFGLDPDFYGTIPTLPRSEGQMPSRARKSAFYRSQTGVSSFRDVGLGAVRLSERLGFDASGMQMGHVYGPKRVNISDLQADPRASAAVAQAARTIALAQAKSMQDGFVSGIKESTKQASPSREAIRAGENIGKGALIGLNSQDDEAQAAGQDLGARVVSGARRAGRPEGPAIVPQSQIEAQTNPRVRVQAPAQTVGVPLIMNAQGEAVTATENLADSANNASESASRLGNRIAGISYGITAVTGAMSMFGGELSQISSVIFGVSSAFSGLIFASQMLMTEQKRQAVTSAVSGFVSGAPGRFSEARNASLNASREALSASGGVASGAARAGASLASLGRGIMAFLGGPWGLAITVVGLLAAVSIPALIAVIEEQTKKSKALANASDFTSESLKRLSERVGGTFVGGNVSNATMAGETEQQKSEIATLAQDESFLKEFETQISGFKELSGEDLILAINNLIVALSAGGDNAESIQLQVAAMLSAAGKPGEVSNFGIQQISAIQQQPVDFASMIVAPEVAGGSKAGINISNIDAVANSASLALTALDAALANQQITQEEFDAQLAKISETIASIPIQELTSDFDANEAVVRRLIEGFEIKDEALLKNIKDLTELTDLMAVYDALAKGATAIDPEVFDLMTSGDPEDQEKAIRLLNQAILDGVSATRAATSAEIENQEVTANRQAIDDYNASVEEKITALNNEIFAYDLLIANGWAAADALDAVSDASLNSALAAAANADRIAGTTTEVAALLDQLNALRALEGRSPVIAARRASVGGGRGGGGGSGPQASALDDLLSKMNKVVSVQTQMTKGWKASRTMLDRLFGGSRTTGNFAGLEQQMRNLGAGEPLIDLIAGMPAEEFNKRKNELFVFDRSGNIVRFRDSLASIGEALRKIALGEFQNKQKATIRSFNDQMVAVQKLVSAGMSYAQAYEIAQDASLANAIANEKNSKSIQQIVKDAKAAEKAMKDMAAAMAVASSNQDFVDQQRLLAELQENTLGLSNDQIQAVLDNPDLQRLVLDPSIDPETLEKALNDVALRKQIELEIKKLTIDGLESIFEDGFSKAMEAFSAQEQKIEIDFALRRKPFEDLIRSAEEQISDITNRAGGLDDLEADLERIGFKEEEINKKYEDRKKALSQVKDINAAIAQQQRSQLTLADALTQGDIAAAARAAQEMREQMRQKSIENQEKALDQAREAEVAALLGNLGLTREQIEQRIRALKLEILEIEESTLEPAKYSVELLDREQQTLVESLTVLGMTKDEWEAIKNQIDVAKTSSDSYTEAIEAARSVVTDIVNYWEELDGKQVETIHIVKTVYQNVGSPPSAGTIPPSGDGGTGSGTKPPAPGKPGTPKPPTSENVYGDLSPTALKKRYQAFGMKNRANESALRAMWPFYQKWEFAMKTGNTTNIEKTAKDLGKALKAKGFSSGGSVLPRMASSLFGSMGTDTVAARLTPGEFVVSKYGVQKFGVDNLKSINDGTFRSGSVYNYDININVRSEANPEHIARVVNTTVRNIDNQRIRGSRIG